MTMMNRGLASIAFVIIACVTASAQNSDAVELTRLLNEFLAGAGRNDAEVHDRFWAEDLIYTRSAGTRIGKAELMKGVRSAPKGKTDAPTIIYTAEDIRIQQYGTAAVVAFRLVGTTVKMDGSKNVEQFLNTGTFVKRRGEWQVVAWQATAVPQKEGSGQQLK